MKDESLDKVIEDMRKRADVAERQDADGQVYHSAVAAMLRDFADRAEAAGAREFSDGATIGHLFGASESRKEAKVGNVSKLRSALASIERITQWGGSDFGNPVIAGPLERLTQIREIAEGALSDGNLQHPIHGSFDFSFSIGLCKRALTTKNGGK